MKKVANVYLTVTTFVSLVFVGTFGYTAICFADQTAWMAATLYLIPMTVYCVRKVTALR